jgi:Zn-dependent peptidase ImmA (M78 family)
MSQRWHPWKHAGEHYPHVTISCQQELPHRVWGLQLGHMIWLCRRLNQVRRRCTLTHELIHLERGPVPTEPMARIKEERVVSALAARRLIPVAALIDAYRWCPAGSPAELAEELWVDIPTLRIRMKNLDPFEVAELEHELNGDWLWIP